MADGWTVLTLVVTLLSLLLIEATLEDASSRPYHGAPLYLTHIAVWLVPHFMVLVLLASGARRLSALAIIVVGVFACIASLLLSLDDAFGGASWTIQALIAVAMVACGIYGLSRRLRVADNLSPTDGVRRFGEGALVGTVGFAMLLFRMHSIDARTTAQFELARKIAARAHEKELVPGRLQRLGACLQAAANRDSASELPSALSEVAGVPGCAVPPPGQFDIYRYSYSPATNGTSARRTKFTLVARPDAVADSSESFVTDESGVVRTTRGRAVLEDPTKGQLASTDVLPTLFPVLQDIARCVEDFRGIDAQPAPPPETLAELSPCRAVPSVAGDPHVSMGKDYVVRYERVTPAISSAIVPGYRVSVEPLRDSAHVALGRSRSYLLDERGAIHVTTRARAALMTDSTLGPCTTDDMNRASKPECLVWHSTRERWGVGQLPKLRSSRDNARTDPVVGEEVRYEISFYPLLAQDSVARYRFAWRAGDADSVVRWRPGPREAMPLHRDLFVLRHVYRDSGSVYVRFSLETVGGERYDFSDALTIRLR